MKVLYSFCIVLLFIIYTTSSDAAITTIVGANVDAGIRPPTGVCTAFNMTNAGILTMPDGGGSPSTQQFDIGVLEDSYDGVGYYSIRDGAGNTRVYKVFLSTLSISNNNQINTVNNPDAANVLEGSYYNTLTGRFVSVGRMIVAPCAAPNCMHFRTYVDNTLESDSTTTIIDMTAGADSPTFDGDGTYLQYSVTTGSRIVNVSPAFIAGASDTLAVGDTVRGLTVDSTFLYGATFAAGGIIKRWDKSNIAAGETNFTPGITTPLIQFPVYDSFNGSLYVAGRSTGVSQNIMYKIRTSDMTIVGSTVFANNQLLDKILIDPVNDKLYVVFETGGNGNITRVNRSTLVIEQTFNGTGTANGLTDGQSRIDVITQTAYLPFNGNGGGAQLQKVSLCD